jgi:integrase
VEDLRNFQLHLVDSGTSPITLNATLTGLRFFFDVTVGRAELMAKMQAVKLPRTLPVVLSPQEVARLIAAARNVKHQAALSVAYGAGLRASEVIGLKVTDVDSQRMTLRVEQGKGSGRARRELPEEGLPRQGQDAPQGHDAVPAGVHTPVPSARAARRIPSHPPLRLAGQWHPQGEPGFGARALARNSSVDSCGWQCQNRQRRPSRSTPGLHLSALRPRHGHRADHRPRCGNPRTATFMTGPAPHLNSVPLSDVCSSAGLTHACGSDQLNEAAVARHRLRGAELRRLATTQAPPARITRAPTQTVLCPPKSP